MVIFHLLLPKSVNIPFHLSISPFYYIYHCDHILSSLNSDSLSTSLFLSHIVTHRATSAVEEFCLAMAAAAVYQSTPNHTAIANCKSSEDVNSTPFKRLSFAASNVTGERITSPQHLRLRRSRTGGEMERRSPVIVSPKAVSDSQNSQTCLDPDASRVINN